MADYVSQRAGISLLYDKSLATKTVIIRSPNPIPVRSLPRLLQSTLRIQGLLVTPLELPGWYRIVEATSIPQVADPRPSDGAESFGGGAATQVFRLEYVKPEKMETFLRPFLTQPGANSVTFADSGLVAVTDYERNLKRIASLIDQIDVPQAGGDVTFLAIEHLAAEELATRVTAIL